MRELPPPLVTFGQQESRTIAFISDSSATVQPQRWTAAASVQNQVTCLLLNLFHILFVDWSMVENATRVYVEYACSFIKVITDQMKWKKLKTNQINCSPSRTLH